MLSRRKGLLWIAGFAVCWSALGHAADQPQWGEALTRNMVSSEANLPATLNVETGENVKWSLSLGDSAYGSPVVASGKVLVGANNMQLWDSRLQGDRAVLLCLNEEDGSVCWSLSVPRIGGDDYLDWPQVGMCSVPTVEGDRVYMMTNRYEVVCLDLNGQVNGNDGPYLDEGTHMAFDGEPAFEVTKTCADILWLLDLRENPGMYPHDAAFTSILLDGPYLYLNTCNGVDNTHVRIPCPDAPSLVAIDKNTGQLAAQDGEGMGKRIFHSTWAPPALHEAEGRRTIVFGGPDGVVYGFEALRADAVPESPQTLKRAWRFDCDPAAPKEDVHLWSRNLQEGPSIIKGVPVVHKNRVYVTVGGDIWWGKREAHLKCIDATQTGEITETGAIWSYPLERHCCSTPAIAGGLVFVPDCAGNLHCVDAETGQPYWTHDLGREVWGSALVADGKVYVGTRAGLFWVFAASKEPAVLASIDLGAPISTTPVAANGMLYLVTQERLFAFQTGNAPAASLQ